MSALIDLYASLDDATLETVASKGVLRRAQADLEKVVIERLEETEIVGTIDGATVRLDAKGLAKSRCSCPAPNTCRHRVALVLAARRRAAAEGTATAASAATDWPQRLAAFDQAALVKAVGRAPLRDAVRLLALAETVAVDVAPLSLRVTLRTPRETVEVSIPAAGTFATIASSLPPRRQNSAHAAAMLAARRHFGIASEEPLEHEAPDQTPAEFVVDADLLAAIDTVLCEAYARGFAVASRALEERLGLLAISVRAEAMPRLSASLKRIAASLEQRRLRSVTHDPAALLSELAVAHALVHALSRASDAETRHRLAGAVRAEYLPAGDLDLVGLGAELFETATGARGVTAYFLELATGRRFSATLARGNANDTTFEPRAAFATETVWGRRFADLATARFRLAGAHASSTGRLSLAQSARASEPVPFAPTRQVLDGWHGAPDTPVADTVHVSWRRLADGLAERFAPALDAVVPSAVPVILVPARVAPVAFDDLTQSLSWQLMDASGQMVGSRPRL
jgi:SWIM zinc finger